MQRQNEWSSNRGYAQHLDVLKRISSRKLQVPRKFTCPKMTLEVTSDGSEAKVFERSAESGITRMKENTSNFRDQQILWENYYLGKRIIETPPVISKRKLDQDYQRHRRLVECLTSSGKRHTSNEFRVKKLQEYKENVELHIDEKTLPTGPTRNLIKLQINTLAFYRQRPTFDNLDLLFYYSNKNGKNVKQRSDSFPADQFLQKNFYFSVSRRLLSHQQALTVQIRNLKGLAEHSIGHFSFPASIQLQSYQAQLFHCGKPIGEVTLSTSYNRKAQFRTSQGEAHA